MTCSTGSCPTDYTMLVFNMTDIRKKALNTWRSSDDELSGIRCFRQGISVMGILIWSEICPTTFEKKTHVIVSFKLLKGKCMKLSISVMGILIWSEIWPTTFEKKTHVIVSFKLLKGKCMKLRNPEYLFFKKQKSILLF
ncbi:hypothetical protein LOTGIDRAFT_158413 [Lottia gigantea]|uniref:Uncharacterized protein n=1 Tax=Lottia gigantea TaxID=225164 RepID=V4B011_LOTGI|nr:hypothetical protein LOTGIDRAFT_158413 [Lottia gigantea]ESO99326.1 hypothetical protein LOTGIDRAFT_158413 [Lottia gigantea]